MPLTPKPTSSYQQINLYWHLPHTTSKLISRSPLNTTVYFFSEIHKPFKPVHQNFSDCSCYAELLSMYLDNVLISPSINISPLPDSQYLQCSGFFLFFLFPPGSANLLAPHLKRHFIMITYNICLLPAHISRALDTTSSLTRLDLFVHYSHSLWSLNISPWTAHENENGP